MGIIPICKTDANPAMGGYSLAGAEFTIKNASGAVMDIIITDKEGKGQSKPLPLGAYTVVETKAPYGFYRNKTVYPCTLTGSLGTDEIVYHPEISIPNQPVTGKVMIEKTGEMLIGADKKVDDITIHDITYNRYVPQFGIRSLPGVTYEIRVCNDIVTSDGMILTKAGTLVDTITTGSNGKATSTELHLEVIILRSYKRTSVISAIISLMIPSMTLYLNPNEMLIK